MTTLSKIIASAVISVAKATQENVSCSSLSGLTPLNTPTDAATFESCSQHWKKLKQDEVSEQKRNGNKIRCYVRNQMFKHCKFIPDAESMIFSFKKNSLSQTVLKELNIAVQDQCIFWDTYQKIVIQALNASRNDAANSMKTAFIEGKHHTGFCYFIKCH